MAEPEPARLVHRLPGRARLRIEGRRGDVAWFDRLTLELALVEGVRAVEANPRTGGLLVLHDGPLEPILQHLQTAGLVAADPLARGERPFRDRLVERLGRLDRAMVRASEGELDGRGALLLALLGLALLQAVRGQLAGPALSLLWYASGLLRPSGRP